MKRCSNCRRAVTPGSDTYVGTSIWPFMVVAVFTHGCGGTYGCVLHEVPDEVLLIDDELGVTSSERDAREPAAA